MKIVIAPDKFKGSITSTEFCSIVENTLNKKIEDVQTISLPLADGGDGTIEIIDFYLKGVFIEVEVLNPYFKKIKANYLYSEKIKTAYIELAEASGLKLLNNQILDCKAATTYGTGELIINAISKGAKQIILGIGGSATNDCGIGMASALGYKFLDDNNEELLPIGFNLSKIKSIDTSNVNSELSNVSFKVACDVNNPLYGKSGAAYIYAKQKGANIQDIIMLNNGLKDFSKILKNKYNIDAQKIPGSGAAGGMGIAAKVFLNAELIKGINLIKELANFESNINNAQWIITGEGKLDEQTFSGKTIYGVIKSAKRNKIKIAAFCGSVNLDEQTLKEYGINYSDSMLKRSINLEDSIKNSKKYLIEMIEDFIELNIL